MCSAKSKGSVRGSCYESAKSNPPISGLKLSNKVDKSCATDDRVCPRGYPPPPGWPLISALVLSISPLNSENVQSDSHTYPGMVL